MPVFKIGYENNNEDRTIAWALEHPGCFAYGADKSSAARAIASEAPLYAEWVRLHGGAWFPPGSGIDLVDEETFNVYRIGGDLERAGPASGYMVESFFLYDWKPLTRTEIERALQLLAWSRADLLELVRSLTPAQLRLRPAGERWDISGILNHIGAGEWFYQERLGHPFPVQEQDLPSDPLERLDLVRHHFIELLPSLEGRAQVVGLEGELWSPRKLLRRAAWHERDHTQHIRKLIG